MVAGPERDADERGAVAAGVNSERVGQPLLGCELLSKGVRQSDLVVKIYASRQRKVCADIQSPVRALIEICSIPILVGLGLSPAWQVIRFCVNGLIVIGPVVLAGSCDIGVRSLRA